MQKLDLHIHTIPTFSDSHFAFSIDVFKRYVSETRIDAVAITNHDLFDATQFAQIQDALDAVVFPGIELNVDSGHVLLIANPSDVQDFAAKAAQVSVRIRKVGDKLSVDELMAIYGDLNRYLVIPHYEKAPAISGESLERLKQFASAGEVDSPKKFVRAMKDESKMTPVLFSDARIREGLAVFPNRQTFVDCGALTLSALRTCLRDKAKVTLSETDGNKLWQVFSDGQKLSTGLNVVIGARSTGKTHLLDEISKTTESVKYIQQFSLVQESDEAYERDFQVSVEKRRSAFIDEYLSGLKAVVDDVVNVNLASNEREVGRFVESLLKSAAEADRKDAYSKCALFDEVEIPVGTIKTLQELIESVKQVIENREFRDIVEKHVQLDALKALICELISVFRTRSLENEKKTFVNSLVKEVKKSLKVRTSAVQVDDVDLYRIAIDQKRMRRFEEIVGFLKIEAAIFSESVQGFRIEAKRQRFAGAQELKTTSGLKTAFSEAFKKYDRPYQYLQELIAKEDLPRSDLYKFFVRINYRILNREGFEVSGGERSEYRLLQEITDAQNFDVLLIDEPESSFDNLFLKSDVNQLLKAISEKMPVIVVTHNNTVGASVGADYLLFTRKEQEEGGVRYRIYSGYPTDKTLRSADGRTIDSHEILMNSLEAGAVAYDDRRNFYEAIKHR